MCSWNETDLITQLPINYKDKVRYLLLGNQQNAVYSETDINYGKIETIGGGITNSEELWSPIVPPISGSYNDYGCINKINVGVESDMMHSFLKKNFIFSDPEEYDIVEDYKIESKTQKTQTLSVYLRAIERGYGCWNSFQGPRTLGYSMILEDVYQEIMKYNPIVMHSDWSDKKNPIHLYMPWQESVQNRINNWYNATFNAFQKVKNVKCDEDDEEAISLHTDLFMVSENYRVFDNHKSLCAHQFSNILSKKIKQEIPITDPTVQYLILAFKEVLLLNGFMDVTRKFYTPQCGKGSQDNDLNPYVLLANCINNIAKKRNKIYKKENVAEPIDANGYSKYMLDHNNKQLKKIKNV